MTFHISPKQGQNKSASFINLCTCAQCFRGTTHISHKTLSRLHKVKERGEPMVAGPVPSGDFKKMSATSHLLERSEGGQNMEGRYSSKWWRLIFLAAAWKQNRQNPSSCCLHLSLRFSSGPKEALFSFLKPKCPRGSTTVCSQFFIKCNHALKLRRPHKWHKSVLWEFMLLQNETQR